MTQYLNDYLEHKKRIEFLIPGSVWKESNDGPIRTIVKIENDVVYYKVSYDCLEYQTTASVKNMFMFLSLRQFVRIQ